MKVLMTDTWLPNQPYVLELARPLSKYVDLTIITNRYYRPGNEPFRCKSVLESKVKEKKTGLLSYFRGLAFLYGSLLFGKYDVIHLQAFKQQRFEMPAYLLARRFTRKKLVCTAHNILPHESGGKKEAAMLRKWYRACDAIIVHNEHSKKVLIDFEPAAADKIRVVPHGTFSEYAPSVKETPHEKTVFLQFGMIRKYKGIDDLLKAASQLPEAFRNSIRIVIAGNQRRELDDTDYQAMLDRYGVGDFVDFQPRRVPDEQVPDYFNGADCCLFPYKEIYGSGALLLAYTFDKPVIASGIPTFVEETDGGKTGLLYDPLDENGLSRAIMQFAGFSAEKKAAMRGSIRELCDTKYSWAVSARRMDGIYREIAGGSR